MLFIIYIDISYVTDPEPATHPDTLHEPLPETEIPRCTKELDILNSYYPTLVDTITDIDSLLPHCVKAGIINFREEKNIAAEKNSPNKVQILIRDHISGPLYSGSSKGFYSLLEIMKSKGNLATTDLAKEMTELLTTTS